MGKLIYYENISNYHYFEERLKSIGLLFKNSYSGEVIGEANLLVLDFSKGDVMSDRMKEIEIVPEDICSWLEEFCQGSSWKNYNTELDYLLACLTDIQYEERQELHIPFGFLVDVKIFKEHRGNGYFKEMMELVEAKFKSFEVENIYLYPYPMSRGEEEEKKKLLIRLISFYESLGWSPDKVHNPHCLLPDKETYYQKKINYATIDELFFYGNV